MKLINTVIHKYKSIESDQTFKVEDDVTILVGMNESGKTSVLEAIAKTNYFQDDSKFKFSMTHDFPRREKKKADKSGEDKKAITCTYRITDDVKLYAKALLGENVLIADTFEVITRYSGKQSYNFQNSDFNQFIKNKTTKYKIGSKSLNEKLSKITNIEDFDELVESYKDENIVAQLTKIKRYFTNSWEWNNPIHEYIARTIISKKLPKFLYYDEYYSLPARISIEELDKQDLSEDQLKTAKALLELADLNAGEIIEADDFEDYIAELEATEAIISEELFKYWSTNSNLSIQFRIDKKQESVAKKINTNYNREEVIDVNIIEHILDIRVKNERTKVSLPLKNRSKGFNWFFSFLVWFKKIQEDKTSKYILLLDEPGLNLHAAAQNDLLRFIEDLSESYQIIYTTHSPFAIESSRLDRVRTVLETRNGSVISDSIQEKDPNTLFPLQAALGYDIAQNLFISNQNLLVEGVSDLVYLNGMSNLLSIEGRVGLSDDITIVPVGGLEKVGTFISLLRGSELKIACLLDSFTDQKAEAKLDKMIREKIIHKSKVQFYHNFIDGLNIANIEDVFSKKDYLRIFNDSFDQYQEVKLEDISVESDIISEINKALSINRFNHYRPANNFVNKGLELSSFEMETLDRFEVLFTKINSLF